jgi:hypothetical protein
MLPENDGLKIVTAERTRRPGAPRDTNRANVALETIYAT